MMFGWIAELALDLWHLVFKPEIEKELARRKKRAEAAAKLERALVKGQIAREKQFEKLKRDAKVHAEMIRAAAESKKKAQEEWQAWLDEHPELHGEIEANPYEDTDDDKGTDPS